MTDEDLQAADLDLRAHLRSQPLGGAGLLGAISAAGDLLHSDPAQLATRDAATAEVIARWLVDHPRDSA